MLVHLFCWSDGNAVYGCSGWMLLHVDGTDICLCSTCFMCNTNAGINFVQKDCAQADAYPSKFRASSYYAHTPPRSCSNLKDSVDSCKHHFWTPGAVPLKISTLTAMVCLPQRWRSRCFEVRHSQELTSSSILPPLFAAARLCCLWTRLWPRLCCLWLRLWLTRAQARPCRQFALQQCMHEKDGC